MRSKYLSINIMVALEDRSVEVDGTFRTYERGSKHRPLAISAAGATRPSLASVLAGLGERLEGDLREEEGPDPQMVIEFDRPSYAV